MVSLPVFSSSPLPLGIPKEIKDAHIGIAAAIIHNPAPRYGYVDMHTHTHTHTHSPPPARTKVKLTVGLAL